MQISIPGKDRRSHGGSPHSILPAMQTTHHRAGDVEDSVLLVFEKWQAPKLSSTFSKLEAIENWKSCYQAPSQYIEDELAEAS